MQNRRQAILKNHAMLGAPRHVASLFWQRYNLRWRNPERNLAELAESLVGSDEIEAHGPAAAAWNEALPHAFRERACVEQLQRGKLIVLVDCKATAYVLGRRFGTNLLSALARRLGPGVVRKIEYRVRPTAVKPASKNSRVDFI